MRQEVAATAEEGEEEAAPVRVRSVARAWQILSVVAQSEQGLAATEIARRAKLPVQATYHLIHTLVAIRALARGENRTYILGLGIGGLAESFYRQISPAPELIDLVRAVAAETGETAYACGWVDGEIVVIHVNRGNRPVQVSDVARGSFDFAHARASGKLLLAYASPAHQAAYLKSHPLKPRTARSITRMPRLMQELEHVRQVGYAVDDEEFVDGVCCIAVPADPSGLYTLTISTPADRYKTGKDSYIAAMKRIARG